MGTAVKRRIPAIIAFSCILAPRLAGLDLSTEAWMGNMTFPWNGVDPIAAPAIFPSNAYSWGVRLNAGQELAEGFRFDLGYASDDVLRQAVSGVISFQTGFLRMGVGPILGTFNTARSPLKSGLSTSMRLELPGVIFAAIRADSSIGGGLVAVGDYTQERNEIAMGWYARNAICNVSLQTKKYSYVSAADASIADTSARYAFDVDIYRKNVPYRVLSSIGFVRRSRTYRNAAATVTDSIGTVILGLKTTFDIGERFGLSGEISSGVYSFGMDDLAARGPDPEAFMFNASLGARLKLGAP